MSDTLTEAPGGTVGRGVRGWTTALGVGAVAQGIWAYFYSRNFYDDFPLEGVGWVSALGPFNDHLTTDVGAALLGMGAVAIAVGRRGVVSAIRAVAAAFAIFGAAHLAFHLGELDPFSFGSAAAQVVSLSAVVVLPVALYVIAGKETS